MATAVCRRLVRPRLAGLSDPAAARRAFLRAARALAWDPPGTVYRPDRLGGVAVLHAEPARAAAAGVLVYVHGGAFVTGCPRTHRALAARLARAAGLRAVVPAYRRAPEHPFPAALEDVRAVLGALAGQGPVVLAGDSAGGNLALLAVAEDHSASVAGLVAFSPFVDLTLAGASWTGNAASDALLPPGRAEEVVALYLGGARAQDASPLWARWSRPPPVQLFAARTEMLRDDTLRMAAVLRAAGGRAEVRLMGDLPHVWPWLAPWVPEARTTIAEAGTFLAACCQTPSGTATSR
ncbi:MAG: alpha/beta hydrolase fold domain-containing protein [Alkalilacustris sp.]